MYVSIADLPERYRAQIRAKVDLKKISKYHNEKTNIDEIQFLSIGKTQHFPCCKIVTHPIYIISKNL